MTSLLVRCLLGAVVLINAWDGGPVTAGSDVLLLGYLAAAVASYGLTAAPLGSHELAGLTARLTRHSSSQMEYRNGPI
jgi:hypothetical protein